MNQKENTDKGQGMTFRVSIEVPLCECGHANLEHDWLNASAAGGLRCLRCRCIQRAEPDRKQEAKE